MKYNEFLDVDAYWTMVTRSRYAALEKIIIAVPLASKKVCSHFIDIGRENIIPVTSGCEE
ncbi:MAG: hypothetical protein WAZ77_19465 [Candidatus Nitrosopolaris sp.]|jgi:hypothetical protein